MKKPKFYCCADVGSFKEKAKRIWGLEEYNSEQDKNELVLFFGLYADKDYEIIQEHKGKKIIFWCGTDVTSFLRNQYRQDIIKKYPEAEHYCENEVEGEELRIFGLKPKVRPSFLEDINRFPVSYKQSDNPQVWVCGHHPKENDDYGFNFIEGVAPKVPEITFHLYGAEGDNKENVIYHGIVPREQFNQEIRKYQCGLRCNIHDGFSEVLMKSLLLGQYPISRIPYEKIWSYETEEQLIELLLKLKTMKAANTEAMKFWIKKVNNYPWK